MKYLMLSFLLLLVSCSSSKKDEWQSLFNGKDLQGWRNYNKQSINPQWVVEDGAIHLTQKGGKHIVYDQQFKDFELKLQWKISVAGNSGIFLRSSEGDKFPWLSGIEMQILDNEKHPNSKNPLTCAGSCYGLIAAPAGAAKASETWQDVHIIVKGSHYQFFLNGIKTADFDTKSKDWAELIAGSKFKKYPRFAKNDQGFICLQDHGDKVWFRNIKARRL